MTEKAHHPEHCLNCGKHLRGRYCSNCGQDSTVHQDTMWHLTKHFFQDITHYDGKLWLTVKPLLTRPGYLTREYLKGKRAGYLNPVRLFIFLNFILFFLMTILPGAHPEEGKKSAVHITMNNANDLTVAKYDSLQNTLPFDKRDGPYSRAWKIKLMGGVERLKSDPKFMVEILEIFMHNLAKLTFFFLIVCACLLWLLYYRRHLLMVNHALFAIHLSCTFLLLSVVMLFVSYLPFGGYLETLVFFYGMYYFYRALLLVYKQSAFKTGLKFFVIGFLLTVIMGMAFVANALVAVMSINA